MGNYFRFLFALVLVVTGFGRLAFSTAQSTLVAPDKNSLFEFLSDCTDCRVELVMPIDSLLETKLVDQSYRANLKIWGAEELLDSFYIKVAARGNYRREKCSFPPLKLDFRKDALTALQWATFDQYKLVTHCGDYADSEQVLIKEFLVYQLYGVLTGKSFRTHLFPILYRDVYSNVTLSTFAFMIESTDELEDRLHSKDCDCDSVPIGSLDAKQVETLALFEYMIGNRDVNISKVHNVHILAGRGPRKRIPIPYDFDFSKIVNAPYVFASKSANVKRVYLGYRSHKKIMPKIYSLFLSKKQEFYDLIDNFDPLTVGERLKCRQYIEDFYADLKMRSYQMDYLR